MLNLIRWKWTKLVVFEPVIDGLSKEVKHHANMVPVVEAIVQVETFAKNHINGEQMLVFANIQRHLIILGWRDLLSVHGVTLLKCLQHPGLNFACVAVLLNSANNLDSTPPSGIPVHAFNHFAERSLSK